MTGALLVIGSVNYDLIFRHPRLPRKGETIAGAELFESCGGKGANQAVAAVRCRGGLGEAAGAVSFAGALGNDARGDAQRSVFAGDDLNTHHLLVLDGIHTGLSAVWVEAGSGDNRIMNSPGANARLTADALAAVPVEEAGLLLIQNETPADGVRSAVARAAGAGVPVIWNPAPIDERNDPGLDPGRIAWVTPNELECAVLLGRGDERIDAGSAADAAMELLAMGYGGAALTLGPAGVMLAEAGSTPTLVPAPRVEAVDTTGAGDAFNGAFAAALLASADSREAVAFGVRYASDSVTRHGTQTSFARWSYRSAVAAPGSSSKLALLGGNPVRTEPWPRWPSRGPEEEQAVTAALRDGDWGGFPLPNERAEAFGRAFARRHDCAHALCVANGTVSLEVALQAMGVEPGAEVIVPAYTFEATASAALFAGCVPVFADIDPETYCIDVNAAEALITERTQAIVPVHLAMTVADLDAIGALAEKHGLAVLEDCAHAHGARWRGRGVGSWGDAGSFSFQSSKLMTAGEGGIVTTSDSAVLDRLHALVNCGRQRAGAAAPAAVIGHNYRMTDLQAAILEVQLERLDRQHEIRAHNARRLRAAIDEIPGLANLRIDPRVTTQAIYQFVVRFDGEAFAGIDRDVFVAALEAEGVPADGRFYEALPRSELLRPDPARYPAWSAALARSPATDCPHAERAAYRESVWLPHQLLLGTAEDVDDIVEAVLKVQRGAAGLAGVEAAEIERRRQARSAR